MQCAKENGGVLALTTAYLHLVVGQHHGVDLHVFDVVAVVADHPGQLNFSDLIELFCEEEGGVMRRRRGGREGGEDEKKRRISCDFCDG